MNCNKKNAVEARKELYAKFGGGCMLLSNSCMIGDEPADPSLVEEMDVQGCCYVREEACSYPQSFLVSPRALFDVLRKNPELLEKAGVGTGAVDISPWLPEEGLPGRSVSRSEAESILDRQRERMGEPSHPNDSDCFTAGPAVDLAEEGPLTIKVYGRSNHDDLKLAEMASDMYCSLCEFKEQVLRRKVFKGEHDYTSADEALSEIWNRLHEILHDHCVDLDSIP